MNFIAMDFETASAKRFSACSLAITIVRNSQIQDEFYTLINPQTPFFWRNTQVHGIHERDVKDAPTFPEVWEHIQEFFTPDKLVIAHNATFDNSVLKNTLLHFEIEPGLPDARHLKDQPPAVPGVSQPQAQYNL